MRPEVESCMDDYLRPSIMEFRKGACFYISLIVLALWSTGLLSQCPQFDNLAVSNATVLCEGESVTFTHTGSNIPPNSNVDWYIYDGSNPVFIGTVPITSDPCGNVPEVLYIMVNPDNMQVGGTGDQCDEFLVLWTGSGGYDMNDILITNLGPGTFQWDNFAPGNASSFSCGVPLPPGPVPENAILIIQSHPLNNVFIDSDELCATGLPVYIITYTGTTDCTGGYFDNNSPCSSCPVMINIDNGICMFSIATNYNPPPSSIDGWGWSNTGSGVFADVVPPVDIPMFEPPVTIIPPFTWTVPDDFCETYGDGIYQIQGQLDPQVAGCPDVQTEFWLSDISCPELVLEGGGDVCEGNCPENPTILNFEIVGDDLPFIVDLVVTASVFPPFLIEDLEVTSGQTLQICLEGFFPSFDPSTGILNVPVLAIGISATLEIVAATSASGCPVQFDQNEITLNFIAAPTADAGPDQSLCSSETIILSGEMGGSGEFSEWTTSGDGDFDDPEDLNTTYTPGPGDIADGEVTLTLSVTDENGSCTPATDELTVTLEPSITIDVNSPITLCDNDEANIIAVVSDPDEPCLWETSGDGDFLDPSDPNTIYTPGSGDISDGTVTLYYTPIDPNVCIENNEPLVIDIVEAPDVTIPQNLEICDGDSVVIEISIEGAYTDVNWSALGDGELIVESETQVTYTPGPMDIMEQYFIVSVMIQSGFQECGLITYNIPVNIIFCDCPDFELALPGEPLCSVSESLDLSDLLITGGAGNWSITNTPPGTDPATISGDVFTTSDSDPGVYIVTYTLDNPEPGCPATESVNILVTEPVVPFAGIDMAFCGAQGIPISGEIAPPDGSEIQWTTSGDGMFMDPTELNTAYIPGPNDSISPGYFLILTALDTVCGVRSDTATIYIYEAPFAVFASDTNMICNVEEYGSVLDLDGLIIDGDTVGIWTNLDGAPVDLSNPDSVNFAGVAEGYYSFQYTTTSATSPCADATYVIIIEVKECLCPILIVQNPPEGVCNDLTQLPLNAFIQAGAPGSWQIISAPPGSNPGTISGSDFIINGCDPGVYRFRFTFDAAPIDGCPDSTELDILVQDLPLVSITGDMAVCDSNQVNLQATLGGSSLGLEWNTNGSGTFEDPNGLNIFYQPTTADLLLSQIMITAMGVDTFGFCPVPMDTLLVSLHASPFALVDPNMTGVCNTTAEGSVVDFAAYVMGGDMNGVWTDLDGSMVNLSNPGLVDFNGVTPGVYNFLYTTQSAIPPCVDSSYPFEVTVLNCVCPDLDIEDEPVHLCESSVFDLQSLVIDAEAGEWTIADGPSGGAWPTIVSDELSTFDATDGSYTLVYTLLDSVPGCAASKPVPLSVEAFPYLIITDIGCDSSETFYEVSFETDALIITSDFGNVSDLGSSQFNVSMIPVGQNIVISAESASGLCMKNFDIQAPDCNCTLFIEDLSDTITLCPGDTVVLIPFVTGAMGLPFSTWVTPSGTKMWPSLALYEEGQYIWIVKDSAGCEERDTFYAKFIGPESFSFSTIPPTCPDAVDGQIIIEAVVEGTPPYEVQVDNQPVLDIDQFPFVIPSVSLGNHIVSITDNVGCSIEEMVNVQNQEFGTIDLGQDVVVSKGDSVFIDPVAVDIAVVDVDWIPQFIEVGVESFWYKPDTTTQLFIMVTDTNGCVFEDSLLITVVEEELFFIPTIFSPNGDQINDLFIIETNLPVGQLVSLEIFDRWGNMLHAQYGSGPYEWNGYFKGKAVQSGVYVYKLLWNNTQGKLKVKLGDITLLR